MKTLAAGVCALLVVVAATPLGRAESPATITVAASKPGAEMSPDFEGLSFETSMVLPDEDGKYFFSPQNTRLIAMLKTLGIKSIRVGGNKADDPKIAVPKPADVDSLFHFADAADVKIIYTLRLKEVDAKGAASIAKYIFDHYAAWLECFSIGNEPNMYLKTPNLYTDEAKAYMEAVIAAVPDAVFCGPSATPGKRAWAAAFSKDEAHSPRIRFITQHAYPGGNSQTVATPEAARDKLLAPDMVKSYEQFYADFAPEVEKNGFGYRLEEINSYFHGGARGASDAYASALWGADCMYWWAQHGALGFNFHMGSIYGAFVDADDGYEVRPLGYAMKAFDIGSHGRVVPLELKAENLNVTAYSVLGDDKTLYITIINKEHGKTAKDAAVTLQSDIHFSRADQMLLTAPTGDVAAQTGLTLGGAKINDDATWNGKWTPADASTVHVPAASIAIIRLSNQ